MPSASSSSSSGGAKSKSLSSAERRVHHVVHKAPESSMSQDALLTQFSDIGTEEMLAIINSLMKKSLFRLQQDRDRNNIYVASSTAEASRMGQLEPDERLIYNQIRDAHTEGIWTKLLKNKTNLHQAVLTRAVKSLESKDLIKTVKSVKNPTRKIYMLRELEPSIELSGGAWYTDNELDTALIQALAHWCLVYIRQETWGITPTGERKLYPASYTRHLPTATRILQKLNESSVTSATLAERDIVDLLQTLVYEEKVEKIPMMSGQAPTPFTAINSKRADKGKIAKREEEEDDEDDDDEDSDEEEERASSKKKKKSSSSSSSKKAKKPKKKRSRSRRRDDSSDDDSDSDSESDTAESSSGSDSESSASEDSDDESEAEFTDSSEGSSDESDSRKRKRKRKGGSSSSSKKKRKKSSSSSKSKSSKKSKSSSKSSSKKKGKKSSSSSSKGRKSKSRKRRNDSDSDSSDSEEEEEVTSSEDDARSRKSNSKKAKSRVLSPEVEEQEEDVVLPSNFDASMWVYRALDVETGVQQGFFETPCARCPVFDFCRPGGPVNASCVYYDHWLESALQDEEEEEEDEEDGEDQGDSVA